jgi:C1A family cysteine protease
MKHILVLSFFAYVFALDLLPLDIGDGDAQTQFQNWADSNGKVYSLEELPIRLAIFIENLNVIQTLNQAGGAVFALTKFADLSPEEFALLLGYKPDDEESDSQETLQAPPPDQTVPDTYDWNALEKITAVKNQGQCGSCWAFAATSNIESVWMISKNLTASNFSPLAPQQIVDCSTRDGGCNGGNPASAFKYVISAGGLVTEASNPYQAEDQNCAFNPDDVEASITNYKYATKSNNEEEMKTATATVAPLVICVDASNWQFYTSGIMKASQCGTSVNHCVQITGYDTSSSTPYWTVRNSWGTDWGEQGFIRLEYGQNTCGLSKTATTSVV